MKVDLEKLRLAVTALSDQVHVGIPEKDEKSFKDSVDITNDFIQCVIDWCSGYKRTISGCGKKYEITVREIK